MVQFEYIEVTKYTIAEYLEVEFHHPEYGYDRYTVMLKTTRDDMDEPIDWNRVAKDMWDKFNHYSIMFDMKITAYYTMYGIKEKELQRGLGDNPTIERVVYEGGNPNY